MNRYQTMYREVEIEKEILELKILRLNGLIARMKSNLSKKDKKITKLTNEIRNFDKDYLHCKLRYSQRFNKKLSFEQYSNLQGFYKNDSILLYKIDCKSSYKIVSFNTNKIKLIFNEKGILKTLWRIDKDSFRINKNRELLR